MNYHNITSDDMLNGSGLRVCLWCSGCEHHCNSCQNPQTWDVQSGIEFDENAEIELFDKLSKDYISGVTFTGGDPLNENNLDTVLKLCNKIRLLLPEKNIWLYTGYTWDEIFKEDGENLRQKIVKMCDVIVDGPYIDTLRDTSLEWRGSSNQKVIDVQKTIKTGATVSWN